MDYYRIPSGTTSIGKHSDRVNALPDEVRAIFQVVQGLLVHDSWLDRYGLKWRREQACSGTVEQILNKALQLDTRSLAIPRSPAQRVIGCCRDFSVVLCAMLRHKGIAARCRCGFATYLAPRGKFEDHWICEYWNALEQRWVLVDPQIDPFQQSFLQVEFSPLDIPASEFLLAGRAWLGCRNGEWAPDQFGISLDPTVVGLESLYGLWFVRGNLLRDFAALNKVETVPFLVLRARGRSWEPWRLVGSRDDEVSSEDRDCLDRVATWCLDPDQSFRSLRNAFKMNTDLQPPPEVQI